MTKWFSGLPYISLLIPLLFTTTASCMAQAPASPIVLHVDLTDAPRRLLHAHMQIPVNAGPLTLAYPQWIPGDHRPTGPIDNLSGLRVRANGQDLSWRRDDVDMYAFHVDVPSGVTTLEVSLDFLATPGDTGSDEDQATSPNLTVLEWNSVVLYPAHIPVAQIPITASLTVPADWKLGTALSITGQNGAETSFATVSVGQLVDSPVITGRYFREFPLAPEITPKHYLDVAGDSAEDVDLKPEYLAAVNQLVRETGPLYQSRHYETYHFLLSLSDVIREEGLEHHQSSDNGIEKKGITDPKLAMLNAELLPHEFTHSWNGKYRRPAGLATPDFATPQKGDLLWVYEGMTQYWGDVLAARSAFWTPAQYRDALAWSAARLNVKPGRSWRNLEDTAIASQILRGGHGYWANWRRGQDYYPEGELIWLDADTTIRQLTHDKKSLNDFCVKFLAVGGNTPPKVVPYDFDEIVDGLNAVAPYDWRSFLTERLQSHAAHAPLGGIDHGGYRLTYGAEPTEYEQAYLTMLQETDAWFSLGLMVNNSSVIDDVRIDSPAFQAGLGPGMKLVAVNGHGYNGDVLKYAIRGANGTTTPIELIVSNDNEFRTVRLDYHDGEKYPQLERVQGTPDLLDEIVKPLVANKASGL
jgi:predicted metalloprotease with PDZ domain